MKKPKIVSAVRDWPSKRVFTGIHHYAAALRASRTLHATLEALVERGLDEGFTVNGTYITRYDVMAQYGIDDSGDL
jgi:hypothetical protein